MTARILVVEDNPLLRDIMEKTLSRQGFAVELAEHADEAIRLFRGAEEPFDLLVTDQMLPGRIRGHQLAWQLTAEDPNLRVLIISGYVNPDDQLERAVWSSRTSFLEKPIAPRDLVAEVRRLLL